jgi:hypothetical protein
VKPKYFIEREQIKPITDPIPISVHLKIKEEELAKHHEPKHPHPKHK